MTLADSQSDGVEDELEKFHDGAGGDADEEPEHAPDVGEELEELKISLCIKFYMYFIRRTNDSKINQIEQKIVKIASTCTLYVYSLYTCI